MATIAAWARRVGLSYLLIYNAGFPLEVLGIGLLADGYSEAKQWLVRAATRLVTGVDVPFRVTGSGDTVFHYCELALNLVLALIAATVWHVATRGAGVSPRTRDLVTVLVRYVLAATMLTYGWIKILPVQMPAPGPDRLLNTLADTSPMGLLWTLMGVSPAYQIFSGVGEALGGVLLFWRRTTLAGALILTGVLANVVALNFAFDVPVKLYSSHLLAMALFLVAPHARRLANVLVLNRAAEPAVLRPFPLTAGWARWTALGVKTLLVLALVVMPLMQSWQAAHQYGFLAPTHRLEGIYVVTSFTRAGASGGAVDDAHRWVRVGIGASGRLVSIQRANGTTRRVRTTIDEGRRTIDVQLPGGPQGKLTFVAAADGKIHLEGTFEAAAMTATLARQPSAASELTGRGFHWISEYPHNR